jgi:hypothetical protein
MQYLRKTSGLLTHAAGKALPVLGGAVSAYDMAKDIGKGDMVGLGIDAGSAALSLSGAINPLFSIPAGMALDIYNQKRKAARDARLQSKQMADRYQQASKIMRSNQKYAASNFSRDLEDPRAGLDSDLYQAISPIIGRSDAENLSPEEAVKDRLLREQVRKGLVGLEYMTGLKKNTGNTYYDEHPVAAVGTDILGNSGKLGLGAGALGAASNLRNKYRNLKMTRPSEDARKGNYGVDPAHPRNLLNPKEGPVRADISRVFGDFTTDPETRLALIDELNASGGKASDYASKYQELVARGEDPKKLFAEANRTNGAAMLEDYANFHESTQRAKASGGLKKYWGEDMHTAPGAGTASEGVLHKFTRENLAPSHMQGFTDLAEASNFTKANPHYNRNILKRIAEEYSPGAGAKAFAETGLRDLENIPFQNAGLSRLLKRTKLPLAAGAAAAAGGTGLYALVKALQNQTHSKQKMDEWRKTLLQARGDFDRASQYGPQQQFQRHQPQLEESSPEIPLEVPPEPPRDEEPPAVRPQPISHPTDIDWSEALNSVR